MCVSLHYKAAEKSREAWECSSGSAGRPWDTGGGCFQGAPGPGRQEEESRLGLHCRLAALGSLVSQSTLGPHPSGVHFPFWSQLVPRELRGAKSWSVFSLRLRGTRQEDSPGNRVKQGCPAPGPWTSTGLWRVSNWAAQQVSEQSFLWICSRSPAPVSSQLSSTSDQPLDSPSSTGPWCQKGWGQLG